MSEVVDLLSPVIGAIITQLVKSRYETQWTDLWKRRNVAQQAIDKQLLTRYIAQSVERNSQIKSVVFENDKCPLLDIYQPLSVRFFGRNGGAPIRVEGFPAALLPAHKRILLTDTAGTGKSTLLKYLYLQTLLQKTGLFPIFVELRQLRNTRLIDLIANQLSSGTAAFDAELLKEKIARGGMAFFLDGYDEIPLSTRRAASDDLRAFFHLVNAAPAQSPNMVLLSSRSDPTIGSFEGFVRMSVERLTEPEAFALIRQYGKALGSVETSEKLIQSFQNSRIMNNVRSFLQNPLLVSLLYRAFLFTPALEKKKANLYETVFEALYKRHDLLKPGFDEERVKLSRLDMDDFHAALRAVAYETFKHGVEYDKVSLVRYIDAAKKRYVGTAQFQSEALLSDLVLTVPIFAVEGDSYRWSHKSLQEYFVAAHICRRDVQDVPRILRAMAEKIAENNYYNILTFVYEMDYKTFRDSLIYDLAKGFVEHCDTVRQNAAPEMRSEDVEALCLFSFQSQFVCKTDANASIRFATVSSPVSEVNNFAFGASLTTDEIRAYVELNGIPALLRDYENACVRKKRWQGAGDGKQAYRFLGQVEEEAGKSKKNGFVYDAAPPQKRAEVLNVANCQMRRFRCLCNGGRTFVFGLCCVSGFGQRGR